MTAQTTRKPPVSPVDSATEVPAARQVWSAATAAWAKQLQRLQTFNFVFRTVWEPETRASWLRQLRMLRRTVLYSQQIWLAWQTQVETNYQGQLARRPKSRALVLREHWERWVAESREVQTA